MNTNRRTENVRTPGKLEVAYGEGVHNEYGSILKADRDNPNTAPWERDRNIEYAVKCWNACDGINPEAIRDVVVALERLTRIASVELRGKRDDALDQALYALSKIKS
jgi:hypothetical protein